LIGAIARRYGCCESGVVPVPGASSGIFISVSSVAEPGDTILVERPVYDPIERVCSFLRLRRLPVRRAPADSFGVDLSTIEAGLEAGARAVVLTNLHNPSGQHLSPDTVRELAARCADRDATLIVDEVYLDAAHLNKGHPRWTAATLAPNVIALNSLTKVYGLAGLRVGWMLSNDELADRARTIMDLLSVMNAAPSTSISLRAFSVIDRLEDAFRRSYQQSQPVYREWLEGEPRVNGYTSHGALFECVKLPGGVAADRLCAVLHAEYDTNVTPGGFFGLPDHIRLSLSVGPDTLAEGLARLSKALRRLT
jgi:aspartate/methionine/tyrosine aminotransferase